MNFRNAKELLALCKHHNDTIAQVMVEREKHISGKSEKEIVERMNHSYEIMEHAIERALTDDLVSICGHISG